MKTAVTGASGFLGKELIQTLVKRGERVIAVSRNPERIPKALTDQMTMIRSDYGFESLRKAFQGADAVIHLAARRLADSSVGVALFREDNVKMTENALKAAAENNVKKFIFASSISVYSSVNRVPFLENQNPEPLHSYGLSKLNCERLVRSYSEKYRISSFSLRFSSLFGWGDETGRAFMPSVFIQEALKKRPLHVWGEGKGGRDLLYVKDAVGAIEKALISEASSGVFNVGGGRVYTHLEIARTVNEVFDNVKNILFDRAREENKNLHFMDCFLAESELKWRREWSLRSGLEEMKRTRL